MDTVEILKQAISERKPISFEYEATDRAVGTRYGNPHVLFVSPFNIDTIDIFKTGGVCTETLRPLPAWRQYKIANIKNIIIQQDTLSFEPAQGYNPQSKLYNKVIAKI